MSTEQLRAAATASAPGTNVAGQKAQGLPALIEKMKPQLALALPKHMNADRMVRIALTELRKNPKLMQADEKSVLASIVMGAQLGLEPGLNGQAYLIPYDDRRKGVTICQFVPGWKGLVDLAQRSGRSSVWTGAVYEDDDFDYELGTSPFLKHKPSETYNPRAKQTHAYAIGRVRGAEFPVIDVWPMAKVWAHRDRFNKVGNRHYSFEHPEPYSRKVVLLQVLKYMPQSIELATAMDLENAAEAGGQKLDLGEAIAGDFSYVPDEGGDGAGSTQAGESAGAAAGGTAGSQPSGEQLTVEQVKNLMRGARSLESIESLWTQHGGKFTGDDKLEVEAFRNLRKEQLQGKA